MTLPHHDIAIIGSGFAGSLLALACRQLGLRVLLLERGQHPRFAIGESSTPLANLLLEELASQYDLPQIAAFSKWGTWRRTYPFIRCGLKRGFSFFQHSRGKPFAPMPSRRNELRVAASPSDQIADTHWFREDFDAFLCDQARAVGVSYVDRIELETPVRTAAHWRLVGQRDHVKCGWTAGALFDATGPRGFLFRAFGLKEIRMPRLPATAALFSHFKNVPLWGDLHPSAERAPFPVDDAALHHLIDGGWIWVLRFLDGTVSAGVAACGAEAQRFNFNSGASAWRRVLSEYPSIQRQFEHAEPIRPFGHMASLSFQCETLSGDHWAMLPSAGGFVDPLLSTGFPLALLGILRVAGIVRDQFGRRNFSESLEQHARITRCELLAAENLIASLYTAFDDFELFTNLSLLYFAAASFSETVRRLGRPELAGGFLLHDHPVHGPRIAECCALARDLAKPREARDPARKHLLHLIQDTIRPINVAGLADSTRRNWYPVNLEDLYAAAPKVRATHHEIDAMLARCGLTPRHGEPGSPADSVNLEADRS